MPKRARSASNEAAASTDFVRGTSNESTPVAFDNTTTTNGDFVRGKPSRSEQIDTDVGTTANSIQETDFLFSKSHREKQLKKRSKKESDAQKVNVETGPQSNKKYNSVESISFKTLRPGIKLLCTIRQVTKKDAVVSLPNALTGYLSIKEVSDYFFGLAICLFSGLVKCSHARFAILIAIGLSVRIDVGECDSH